MDSVGLLLAYCLPVSGYTVHYASNLTPSHKAHLNQGYTTFSSFYKLIVSRPAKGLYNIGQPLLVVFWLEPSLTDTLRVLTLYRVVLMMTSSRCTNTVHTQVSSKYCIYSSFKQTK